MPIYIFTPAIAAVALAVIVIVAAICFSVNRRKETWAQGGAFDRRHQNDAVAYCGSCGVLPKSSMNDLLIGRRFICPMWRYTSPHIGAVIRRDELGMKVWLCVQSCLMRYLTGGSLGELLRSSLSPIQTYLACYLRRCPPLRWLAKRILPAPDAIFVLLIWAIVLLALLWLTDCWSLRFTLATDYWDLRFVLVAFFQVVLVFLASYHILDSLLFHTAVAFVTQQPRLPLRSAILGGVAFFELSLAFALFYSLLPEGAMSKDLSGINASYFSLVTIVTLGYGDIYPCSPCAQILVMAEIVVGLYFLSTLLTPIVNWANALDTLPTLRELREKSDKLDQEDYY